MLLVHPIREVLRVLPAIAGLALFSRGNEWFGLASLPIVVGFGLTRWFTTTYRVTAEQVQVRTGLLRRKELSVPRDRVRTVDVTAQALQRVVGLVRMTVGTGGAERKGETLHLDGLTAGAASRLRDELLHGWPASAGRGAAKVSLVKAGPAPSSSTTGGSTSAPGATTATAGPVPGGSETELARLVPAWVRFGPFSLSGFVALGVIGAFWSRLINEAHVDPTSFGPFRALTGYLGQLPLGLVIVEALLVCLVVVTVTATLGYVIAFWGFRLTRHSAGTLHVSRGLITSRATTIEERRLHGVELSEPVLLRLVGGVRLNSVATGLAAGSTLLLPPAPYQEGVRVGANVLGALDPLTCPLVDHGPAARRRRYSRALLVASVLIGLAVLIDQLADGPAWIWQASLVLLPLSVLLAEDRYRSLGHALLDGHLVSRHGSVVRRRSVLAHGGIIGWNLRQSFFQRRARLATLTITTAAGRQHYEIVDIPFEQALRVADLATPGLVGPFLDPAQ